MTSETPQPGDLLYRSEWETERTIPHEEAHNIARRLIASHFRRTDCETARASIPARPDYDDDLLINAYIKQQARKDAALASTARAAAGGSVLVPRKITMPMGSKFYEHRARDDDAQICWEAMIEAAPAVPASPRSGDGEGEEASLGWLFWNPDSGVEWSADHPVESGEAPDAEEIRPATLTALKDEMLSAWHGWEEERREANRLLSARSPAPAEHGVEIRDLLSKLPSGVWGVEHSQDRDAFWIGVLRSDGTKLKQILYGTKDLLAYRPEYAEQHRAFADLICVLLNSLAKGEVVHVSDLSQGGQAGGSEKSAGDLVKIANHAHLLELAASRLEADGWPANAGSCLNAAAFLRGMIADPAQSPSTSDGEG